ncbi:MAG: uroporphyrinogen decarboxylase, partial [Limisphaerales bacterium]
MTTDSRPNPKTSNSDLLQNDLLLRTAAGEQVERPPVWLMRQAGRILPQYRKLRASVDGFKALVRDPELVCEVTIQPVDELGVDAAIIFSDILVIPEAMGLPYEMQEGRGPYFENFITAVSDIDKLRIADPAESLSYVTDGIKLTKAALDNRVPLIGFAGAPWTIFSYMIEGGGSKTFSKARAMLYREPEASKRLLDMITESTIAYLKAKVAAGVDIIQVFDSWAGILSPDAYKEFALPGLKKIAESITDVPVILFAKDAYFAIDELTKCDAEVIGLDWHHYPAEIRAKYPNTIFQGNLDPVLLYAPH